MKSYIYNKKNYDVKTTFSGQYAPYGDSHLILEIRTRASKEETLEFLKEVYKYDVPSKENWDTSTPESYFKGYYMIDPMEDGWIYNKTSPYTD